MIDVPAGWATIVVAMIAAAGAGIGAIISQRASRVGRLERENRQLWFGLRLMVDSMYRAGITPHPMILELLNLDEDMNTRGKT